MVNVAYTRNIYSTSILASMIRQEAWNARKSYILHIRIFGCITYVKISNYMRSKLDTKGTKCIFLEYCKGTNAYRLMYLNTKKIIKSCDVEFLEHESTYKYLKMCPNRSNDVFVDTSFNSTKK